MLINPDLTYACFDMIWTRFFPETPAGDEAWRVMAAADPDGVVAFLPGQVAGVIAQLEAAGLTVQKLDRRTIPDTHAILEALDI